MRVVTVQVIIYRLIELNTVATTFDAIIIIISKWRENGEGLELKERELKRSEYAWSPELFVENSVRDPVVLQDFLALERTSDGHFVFVERIKLRGKFVQRMKLNNFPFDIQALSLRIQSRRPSEVLLKYNPSSPHVVLKSPHFEGKEFRLYLYVDHEIGPVPDADTGQDSATGVSGEELTVNCFISRNPMFYLINIYLIAFLLCLLGFLTFAVYIESTKQRNFVSYFLAVATITHRYKLFPYLPKTKYVSHAEKYCLTVMGIVALLCIWQAIFTNLSHLPEPTLNYIDAAGFAVYGLLIIVSHLVLWCKILRKWCRHRRFLENKEIQYAEALNAMANSLPEVLD